MAKSDTINRIKRIQSHLGVPADGIIGPTTLTALENMLFDGQKRAAVDEQFSLTLSKKGLNRIVEHEITSSVYYQKFLSHPIWPGGQSGITIGIGYDLGQNNEHQIRKDWAGKLSEIDLDKIVGVSGLTDGAAGQALKTVESVFIPLETAQSVFYESTLKRYAAETARVYPGVEKLHPNAQTGLLSLIYNRGASLTGDSRIEMAAIKDLVARQDYTGISQQIRAMKRLWENKGLEGLLKRRDDEARLVIQTDSALEESEVVRI